MPTLAEMGNRQVTVHDPSTIIKDKDTYYLFSTMQGRGRGVMSRTSKDLITWQNGPNVLTEEPTWVAADVPNNRGGYWAPDVVKVKDGFYLYYAVSTFGSRSSAIGVASSPTLDPNDPNYKWTDLGPVIETSDPRDYPGEGTNYNAIDPAILLDADGKLWMVFGSFWECIKLIQLDPATGKRITPDSPVYSLATSKNRDTEASYLYNHDGYYYLFVDWGKCCQGVASTYKVMVGRSKSVTGPYLDKDGADMAKGGGTLFLGSEGDFIGPGHAGIIEDNGKYWFSCHFYDGTTNAGTSRLAIRPLHWNTDGWPEIEPKQYYVAENTRVAPPRGGRGNFGATGARGRGRAGAGSGTAPAPAAPGVTTGTGTAMGTGTAL